MTSLETYEIIYLYLEILERQTSLDSDICKSKKLPIYKIIANMGKSIVPALFQRIKTDPFWQIFLLLEDILKDGPEIPFEDRGRFDKFIYHWLEYGKKHGYYTT